MRQAVAAAWLLLLSGTHAVRLGGRHAVRRGTVAPGSLALQRSRTPVMASTSTEHAVSEIEQLIAAQAVVVYSKSWCPYCAQCKALLDSMEQPYAVVELDRIEDGEAMQAALLRLQPWTPTLTLALALTLNPTPVPALL